MKNYESPQLEVIEIEMEGVICASGGDTGGNTPSDPVTSPRGATNESVTYF